MAWSGYLTFDGTEIANGPRTEAYVGESQSWFYPLWDKTALPDMLEQTYTDPATDGAPWYDPDVPASADFWGFYPSDFAGFESSSRTSQITENAADGGTPGRVRHGTKAVVCSGALLGASQEAVDYGIMWLRRALLGAKCSELLTTDQALGVTVGYLAAEPVINYDVDTSEAGTLNRLQRFLHRASVNNGPTVMFKGDLACGAAVMTVQFTIVAGSPFEFGAERQVLQDWNSASDPWVPGVPNGTISGPATYNEVECGQDQWAPIFDPDCPALIIPPPPPSVPLGCFEVPASWSRRTVTIPAQVIPEWGQVVPKATFFTTTEIRGIRVRFYEDPDSTGNPNENPCDFIGDFLISYLPANATMVIDANLEEIFVITAQGYKRRADSLVFKTDGTPFDWPSMSCGYGYIMTMDLPSGAAVPVVDLSLTSRVV